MQYSSGYGEEPYNAAEGSSYPAAEMDYEDRFSRPGYPQPAAAAAAMPQPALSQPSYVNNSAANEFDFNQSYAHREGAAPSVPPPASPKDSPFGFMKSKWPAIFMGIAAVQAAICLSFEAYVFGQFEVKIKKANKDPSVESQEKIIPTFLTLFIFGFLYELVLVWDALRKKNTIQVIGLCCANLALMIYTTIQCSQIQDALSVLQDHEALDTSTSGTRVWEIVRPFLDAIPAILALGSISMAFVTFKLYQKFAWDILKNIGADYRMKQRFLHYQIYIALLKFDFFFFLGFIIQFVVIVAEKTDPEFALTIATIPVTIIILILAAWFTRIESKGGMVIVIIIYFGGLSYFIFKLVRIYEPGYRQFYQAVQKSLTAFAVITILLIILTIANAILCMCNFNKGLKAHLQVKTRKRSEEDQDLNSINMHDVKQPLPSRMTID